MLSDGVFQIRWCIEAKVSPSASKALFSWEDKQSGQKRNRLKVVGEGLQLLGSRSGGQGGAAGADFEGEAPASRPSRPAPAKSAPPEASDDDIPF